MLDHSENIFWETFSALVGAAISWAVVLYAHQMSTLAIFAPLLVLTIIILTINRSEVSLESRFFTCVLWFVTPITTCYYILFISRIVRIILN